MERQRGQKLLSGCLGAGFAGLFVAAVFEVLRVNHGIVTTIRPIACAFAEPVQLVLERKLEG